MKYAKIINYNDIKSLMIKGNKRDLNEDDLWRLDEEKLTRAQSEKLENEWRKVSNKQKIGLFSSVVILFLISIFKRYFKKQEKANETANRTIENEDIKFIVSQFLIIIFFLQS